MIINVGMELRIYWLKIDDWKREREKEACTIFVTSQEMEIQVSFFVGREREA